MSNAVVADAGDRMAMMGWSQLGLHSQIADRKLSPSRLLQVELMGYQGSDGRRGC